MKVQKFLDDFREHHECLLFVRARLHDASDCVGNLQDEIVELKRIINERDEENKVLKASADKYERRSKYIQEKF